MRDWCSKHMRRVSFFGAFVAVASAAVLADSHCPRPPGVPAGARYSCPTRTQTYQPGEPIGWEAGGYTGRGRSTPGTAGGGDVYCQQTPEGQVIPQPYGGTRRNIPCGPNFVRQPPADPCQGENPPDWCPVPDAQFGACLKAAYDIRNDVPDADPTLRYTLGFERGFAQCLEKQVTVQNLAFAALAARFKEIALALMVMASPGVIDGVLHPPGSSPNPNPYIRGREEGGRLCEWGMKVSPVLVARCRPGQASPGKRICRAEEVTAGLASAAGAAQSYGGKRMDCFPCTMAWLKGEPYQPPAGGGRPWDLQDIIALFKNDYADTVPQGPELPCWRQAAQAKGIPGSMTPTAIESEMAQAGDGAKGAVLILDPLSGEVGHVFGVKTIGSGRNAKVEFWDPQQQGDGKMLWFQPGMWEGKWVSLYRIQ